jgi:hypothetical protein
MLSTAGDAQRYGSFSRSEIVIPKTVCHQINERILQIVRTSSPPVMTWANTPSSYEHG